ncbi:hypothetical protein LIX60_17535 [Streptomyces sp. S07_1.15]|uniref:hypothetical protein n=1 Tax=Streptomyces sp. S07_1.15 TaxID=2873925 RepID=UPI001D133DFC|nr:hypothetical protein [Streptomyces sp. S07_1.15]MCC3653232.1 hypothetical protein [Streptomyces sp. S07_1.15]
MHVLAHLAGRAMSPQGEAVFLLLWGTGAGLVGWFSALKRTGYAEAAAAWGDQMHKDFHSAYGLGDPPSAEARKNRRIVTKLVGWFFAIVGTVCAITGAVLLAQQ